MIMPPRDITALLAVIIVAALAPTNGDARVRWSTPGSYRLQFVELRPYQIDAEGKKTGEVALARHRLRLRPTVEVGIVSAHIELDVLTGQIFGTTTAVGADFAQRREIAPDDAYDGWTTVEPRQAWFDVTTPWAYLKVGQYSDHWGLGLLQNGGDAPEDQGEWLLRPSQRWLGDLVTRGQVSLRPAATLPRSELNLLQFTLGGGIVYQDEEGTLFEEDHTTQLLFALEYPGDSVQAGLEYLHRDQTGRDAGKLETTTIDAYLKWRAPLFLLNSEFMVELEYAAVAGERLQPDTFGAVDPVEIDSWAAVGRIGYRLHCPRVAFGVDFGYLSGDKPDTEVKEGFRADPDFALGFILFPDVLRSQTVRSAELLRLEEQKRTQFLGANELPTKGAGRNAVYFAPAVTWRPGPFNLGLYALAAWGAEEVFDPYTTLLGDGAVTSALGESASRYYGTELSMIAQYQLDWAAYTGARMGITAGILLPGAAIALGDAGTPISKFIWSLGLGW